MTRRYFACLLILLLAACAPRGVLTIVPDFAAQAERIQKVYVASNRLPKDLGPTFFFEQTFGDVRDPTLRFGRIDLSVPTDHQPGQIEWPGRREPDPERHFVATGDAYFANSRAFLNDIGPAREVVVFVHGFNVNGAEAIYRLAQIAVDYEAREPVIAFSWPSAGSPRGYAYDRDSVMFSRDGLEELLTALSSGGHDVMVVAHSMGSQLVMETLRQLSISGKKSVLRSLSGVALISPDIDEDVFVVQAERIEPFPQPFTLLTSAGDRALDVSAFLTGKPSRLGSINDPERLRHLPVNVVDLTKFKGGDKAGHSTAFTAPEAIKLLRGLTGRGQSAASAN